jgi:helix-turn-helix, Psq domain
MTQEALSAGETLAGMAHYWSEATDEERRDMVWSLLNTGELIYDLERRVIVGILPRESVLPVLSLGLESTAQWEQRGSGLWLSQEYWPEKRERSTPHVLPPQESSLTLAQQEEALEMLRSGVSLRQVAQHFGINHESVRRMARRKRREEEE